MSTNFWLDNAAKAGTHALVDLGYYAAKSAQDRANQLRRRLGKRNFMIGGSGRLMVRLPTNKADAILKEFSAIRTAAERPGYCWCTHTWLDAESVDLKFAAR